jgi:type IV pilus assembly protein PilY1
MNKVIRTTTGTVLGLILALTVGAPAIADDTELLLVDPNNQTPKPNILFIIDSSGSMTNEETTKEPFDTLAAYGGTCDPTMLYWTEYDAVPSCDPTNTRMIAKTSFLCDAGAKQLAGIGIYSNKMTQYRDGSSGFFSVYLGVDATRWQELKAGYSAEIVECKKDRGVHGDGINLTLTRAQSGGGNAPYTDRKKDEISWRSWPTSQDVTVYDGNYLNYRGNPVVIQQSRIGIVQTTANIILGSISDVNVGIMRFNSTRGGPVIHEMADLDTNRTTIMAAVNGIVADGWTPVAETLYESALYWRGMEGFYANAVTEHATAPGALASTGPEVYQAPISDACAKNYNVLLTDGAPTNDVEAFGLVGNLPNWFGTMGNANCVGAADGDCADDIAQYLYTNDTQPTVPGAQLVTTHTIGFAINLPILAETARVSGGEYFLADDIESLTLALMRIFTDINEESLSFAAPAVAVNSFNRTQNLNDLYLTAFQASEQTHWPGNLKKYKIAGGEIVDSMGIAAVDPNTGFFKTTAQSYWSINADGNEVEDGGAANRIPTPANRRLFTNLSADPNLTAASNSISSGNVNSFTFADFGLTGSASEPTIDMIVRWMNGEDVADVDGNPATVTRDIMGDPLHSQPAAVVYGGTPASPDIVVYTATNDGYVHAIDGASGRELWAFVPREHLQNQAKLFFDPASSYKNYGVDGDIVPVIADRNKNGIIETADGDFVYIIFGMRRGGDAYYALDVTDKNNPDLKWRISSPEFGQTWSAPSIARIDINDGRLNADKAVAIIGGGYDTVHDSITHPATADSEGAGIYFLDLETGVVLWRAGPDAGANLTLSNMTRAIPNQVRVVDFNGDGLADRMYSTDVSGQIWRFDITNGMAPNGVGVDALVAGGVIAQLGAEGLGSPTDPETRRLYNAPDISIFNDNIQNRRFLAINIGSGYRSHPLDDTNNDRFFSIRDKNVFNKLTQTAYNSYSPITEADLVEVSGSVGAVVGPGDDGWMLTLPSDQKVLSTSTTFDNEVFFVAFSADGAAAATCAAGRGQNFLYRVLVANGDPVGDLSGVVPGTEDSLRVSTLAQGGIAPSPRFLFPSPDAVCPAGTDCTPPPLGCIGVECFDPGFENDPVLTLWTQDGIE